MADEKPLILLIVNHLKRLLNSGKFNDDALESMEVAVQCIESAYSLNPTESDHVVTSLQSIVDEHFKSKKSIGSEISQAAKEKAEFYKRCGNDFMKTHNIENAISSYTKSISLDPYNPIYYGNRAAAYNDSGRYLDAIEDCQKAIEIDPNYCKAYCRLGLAFSYLKDYQKAVSCYKKACELDPGNPGYQRNYEITLDSLHNERHQQSQPQNQSSIGGEQNLMESATRFMNNPEVTSVLNNILGNAPNGTGGLDRLLQVGQTLVNRMQSSNPNLINNMRVDTLQFGNTQNEAQPPPPPQDGAPNQNNN